MSIICGLLLQCLPSGKKEYSLFIVEVSIVAHLLLPCVFLLYFSKESGSASSTDSQGAVVDCSITPLSYLFFFLELRTLSPLVLCVQPPQSWWPSAGLAPLCCCLDLGSPKLVTVFEMLSHKCLMDAVITPLTYMTILLPSIGILHVRICC